MTWTIAISTIAALAWWSFLLALCAAVGFGVAFGNHWFRYGSKRTAVLALSIYIAGAAALLLLSLAIAISGI